MYRKAFEEFEEFSHYHLDQDWECYDEDYLAPLASDGSYHFMHWNEHLAARYPDKALSKIWSQCMKTIVPAAFEGTGIKPGHCVLRVIKNLESEPFGKHVDIDFYSHLIASLKDGEVMEWNGGHYGLQAEFLIGKKAKPHMFNPIRSEYDMVFFTNAHFSTPLPQGGTVGSYLTAKCYRR